MADSFIINLDESSDVKGVDYTIYDIKDLTSGIYYSKKVSYSSLYQNISSDLYDTLNTRLNNIENSVSNNNTTLTNSISNKLDKTGTNLGVNEKMSGPLNVNSTLTVSQTSKFSANVDLTNNKILNLATPTLSSDAVNKNYVDTKTNSLSGVLYLSGGTMTGSLILSGVPQQDDEAATKKYVETSIGNIDKFLLKTGGTVTGAINYNSMPSAPTELVNQNYVSSNYLNLTGGTLSKALYLPVTAPTSDTEAVNKSYVVSTITSAVSSKLNKIDDTPTRLHLKSFNYTVNPRINSTSNVTLDLSSSSVFQLSCASNITGFTILHSTSGSRFQLIVAYKSDTPTPNIDFIFNSGVVYWTQGLAPGLYDGGLGATVYDWYEFFTPNDSDWFGVPNALALSQTIII